MLSILPARRLYFMMCATENGTKKPLGFSMMFATEYSTKKHTVILTFVSHTAHTAGAGTLCLAHRAYCGRLPEGSDVI